MSTPASSRVTTTTTVSVYATDTLAADRAFSSQSATISLPTPTDATSLPPLTSSAAAFTFAAATSATSTTSSTRSVASALSGGGSTSTGIAVGGTASGAEQSSSFWKGAAGYVFVIGAMLGPLILAARL